MKIAENIKGKLNQRCHLNSMKHSKATGSDIYVGFYVSITKVRTTCDSFITEYVTATPHFWNVKDDVIYDTSLGSRKGHYFGKKISKKYTSSNKMYTDLLWGLMKEDRIETIEQLENSCLLNNFNKLV